MSFPQYEQFITPLFSPGSLQVSILNLTPNYTKLGIAQGKLGSNSVNVSPSTIASVTLRYVVPPDIGAGILGPSE